MGRVLFGVVLAVAAFSALLFSGGPLLGQEPDSDYVFSVESAVVGPEGTATVTVSLDSSLGVSLGYFQYGLCHDPTELTLDSVVSGTSGDLDTIGFGVTIRDEGFTTFAVMNVITGATLPPGVYDDFESATYTAASGFVGVSELEFCSTLGGQTPVITVLGPPAGPDIVPVTVDGAFTVFSATPFVRGDVNEDGEVDLLDAIVLLEYLFLGELSPSCAATAELNGDELVDVADGIGLVAYLFGNGVEPAAPFPECGIEESSEETDCDAFAGCE